MRRQHRTDSRTDCRTESRAYVVAALAGVVAAAVALLLHAGPLAPAPPAKPVSVTEPASSTLPSPTSRGPVGDPVSLDIPAIGVTEELSGVGLDKDGAMQLPDYGDAAWYEPGPRPGDPGGAVLVAHVHGPDGPDVFWDLAALEPGDQVTVEGTEGVRTWVVVEVEDVPKEQLPYDRIWTSGREPLLRLITCGGERAADGSGYPDNTIVYARPA